MCLEFVKSGDVRYSRLQHASMDHLSQNFVNYLLVVDCLHLCLDK
jgi:hypothetical protein